MVTRGLHYDADATKAVYILLRAKGIVSSLAEHFETLVKKN